MATPHCPGTISTGAGGTAICSVAWETPSSSWDAVDPADAAAYFGSGAMVVLMFFLVGKGVGAILQLLRR